MAEVQSIIEVRIDVRSPIELGDFVEAFASLASQYQKYMKAEYPDLDGDARIYVREMRAGSIVADLIPLMLPVVSSIETMLVIDAFVRRIGELLSPYLKVGGRAEDVSKGDLKDIMDSVQAIANDPNGRQSVRHVYYEDGKREVKASVEFDTKQARTARREIEAHRQELDRVESAEHERVLMYFKRSDIGMSDVGKRSGERVIIEDISEANLPLIYASSLAEERIKHEIRESDDNPYKKGFVVDVDTQTKAGRPVAYAVKHVHQVIDLPDDDVGNS